MFRRVRQSSSVYVSAMASAIRLPRSHASELAGCQLFRSRANSVMRLSSSSVSPMTRSVANYRPASSGSEHVAAPLGTPSSWSAVEILLCRPLLDEFDLKHQSGEVLGEDGEYIVDAGRRWGEDGLELLLISSLSDLSCELMVIPDEICSGEVESNQGRIVG